nr:hypothetical protein OG781_02270 [Streptomyces sp. NBC_00830]
MPGVVGEPEHGVRLIAQTFQQVAGGGLFSPRGARMLRQPDGVDVVPADAEIWVRVRTQTDFLPGYEDIA